MSKISQADSKKQDVNLNSSSGLSKETILFFREDQPYGSFSNFSADSITVDGQNYKTVEHFYQATKFQSTDPDWAQIIMAQDVPILAFFKGQDRRHTCRSDWQVVKDDVMRVAVMTKALTHSHFRHELLETSDKHLVENNPKDSYWGCGKDGLGKNMLGKILMEIRSILSRTPHALSPEDYLSRARSKF